MTNGKRTGLAFLFGSALTAIGLVIVNVFFPNSVLTNPDPWVLTGLVIAFGGAISAVRIKFGNKLSISIMASMLGFAFTSYFYMGSPDYLALVLPIWVLCEIFARLLKKREENLKIEKGDVQ